MPSEPERNMIDVGRIPVDRVHDSSFCSDGGLVDVEDQRGEEPDHLEPCIDRDSCVTTLSSVETE